MSPARLMSSTSRAESPRLACGKPREPLAGFYLRAGLLIAFLALLMPTSGCDGDRQGDLVQLQAFLIRPRRPTIGVEYRVYPPDMLTINSIHVPEINGVVQQIRPDGRINVPLLGEIFVAGHTPAEIEIILQDTATLYYRSTDAKVVVSQYNSQKYFVMGQVGKPGPRVWTGRNTVLDALADATVSDSAWPERIRVLRSLQPSSGGYLPLNPAKGDKSDATMTDKGTQELTVDMMAMIRKGDMSHNILLLPDDVIYVPPNNWSAVAIELRRMLAPVSAITEAIWAPQTWNNAITGNSNNNSSGSSGSSSSGL